MDQGKYSIVDPRSLLAVFVVLGLEVRTRENTTDLYEIGNNNRVILEF